MNPFVESNPAHDLFKFVKPQYADTILKEKLYFQKWDSESDQVIVEAKGRIVRATNLLGTCFSNGNRAFRNAKMWYEFAERGTGICFCFFNDPLGVGGGTSGDFAVALASAPKAFTNAYFVMDGTKAYKIDNYSEESYKFSELLTETFDEQELTNDEDAVLMLNKPSEQEYQSEVRIALVGKPGEGNRFISFNYAAKRFEIRGAVFGPEFNQRQIPTTMAEMRKKFGDHISFIKIRSWNLDFDFIGSAR